MIKIFNYGVGMAVYVENENAAQQAVAIASQHNLTAIIAAKFLPPQNVKY